MNIIKNDERDYISGIYKYSVRTVLVATLLALVLSACGTAQTPAAANNPTTTNGTQAPAASGAIKLKVGVSPVPHGEILKFVKDNLAAKEGLDIEIVEFSDYVQPNLALKDGQLDANYFQHAPYM
jgi:D-methionine transport system substrate-binding protein